MKKIFTKLFKYLKGDPLEYRFKEIEELKENIKNNHSVRNILSKLDRKDIDRMYYEETKK